MAKSAKNGVHYQYKLLSIPQCQLSSPSPVPFVAMPSPPRRIERFFREALGLAISQGSIVNWGNAAKKGAEPAAERIKELIMQSEVTGYDETG